VQFFFASQCIYYIPVFKAPITDFITALSSENTAMMGLSKVVEEFRLYVYQSLNIGL